MGANDVLITGGSRGIGKRTAQLFREKGYAVSTPSREELDLSSKDSVNAWLGEHRMDGYGILVNNAGINIIKSLGEIQQADLEEILMVNLVAPFLLIQGLVDSMRQNGFGRIVNIGSIWCEVSKPGRSLYSMTKYGLHGITKALSSELAPYGILINTVCPGFTMTELTTQTNTPEQIDAIKGQIPLQRMADPEEIARAVFFAGSRENTYMTGQKIIVDGGYTSI